MFYLYKRSFKVIFCSFLKPLPKLMPSSELKILQARLRHFGNRELKMYKMGFEEAEKSEIKLTTFVRSWRKQSSSRNKSASLTISKPLTVWITTNCRKFLKRWEYQTTLPVFWETCMRVKKQQLELNMEQWTGSKLGKEYVSTV